MKYQLYSIILILFGFCSCSTESISKVEEPNNEFNIIFPLEGQEVEYCCFNFDWEQYKDETSYIFTLEDIDDMHPTIMENLVNGESIQLKEPIKVNKRYRWSVRPESGEEPVETLFKVKDYGQVYEGSYIASKWDFRMNGGEVTFRNCLFRVR